MNIADGMDPAKIQKALAEVAALKGVQEKQQIVGQLLAKWAETDPKSAMTYAQGLKGMERRMGIYSVIGSWAENDFAAAEQWVSKLPAGAEKNTAYQSIVGSLAQTDPERALAMVQKVTPQMAQQSMGARATPLAPSTSRTGIPRRSASATLTPGDTSRSS